MEQNGIEAIEDRQAATEISVPLEFKSDADIILWLQQHKTPLDMVDLREGRAGQTYYYLRHQYVVETLNRLCRYDWDFRVLREWIHEKDDQVTILGELTLRVAGREITKQQFGSSDIERFSGNHHQAGRALSIGDNMKSAASDAMKKCASLVGLGLDLSMPIQPNTMKTLHATGGQVYADAAVWKQKRQFAIRIITNGRKDPDGEVGSSKVLTDIEARILIGILRGDKSDVVQHWTKKLK